MPGRCVIVAAAVLAASGPAVAQTRAPILFEVTVGWETRLVKRAAIPPTSPARADGVPADAVVYYAYDQFVLGVPVWTARGRYVAHLPTDVPGGPRADLYEFKEQDPARLARDLGVPAASLDRPFSYFVPQGWFVVAAAAAMTAVLGRRRVSPHRRFESLWADSRYRAAAAAAFGLDGTPATDALPVVLAQYPIDLDVRVAVAAGSLTGGGVPGRTARRELDFLTRYLAAHRLVVVAAWPAELASDARAGPDVPAAPVGGNHFRVPCECGGAVGVPAGMAGTSVRCACGRSVNVPTLGELRRL